MSYAKSKARYQGEFLVIESLKITIKTKQLTAKRSTARRSPEVLAHPDTNKIDSESKRASLQRRVSLNNEIFSTPGLNTQYSWEEKKKLREQVYKKLLYRESDLLDVGMVVQKARKQGTVLLQWGFIGFYNKLTVLHFANRLLYCLL